MTKRVLRRRKLNKNASLRALEIRLMSLPDDIIKVCDDMWLSSFDMFDTIPHCEMMHEIDVRYEKNIDNPILRLYRVCLARGMQPRGVSSVRVRAGKRLASLPAEEMEFELFVGTHNSFSKKKRSVFALAPEDKRYFDNQFKDQYGRNRDVFS